MNFLLVYGLYVLICLLLIFTVVRTDFFTENYWYNPPSEWKGKDIAVCIILSLFIFPVVIIVVWSFVFSPAIHKFFLRPLLFKKKYPND